MIRHFPLLLLLAFLVGCKSSPVTQQYQYLNETFQAESLGQQGKHNKAASLYQSLAKSKPTQRDHYNLLAAEEYVRSGDIQATQLLVRSIKLPSLSSTQRNRFNFLHAQILLSNGEAEQALKKLKITKPYGLASASQITYFQLLAFAHSLSGDLLRSVQARISLNPLLTKDQQNENNSVILSTLKLLSAKALSKKQPSSSDILAGWMALTKVLKVRHRQSAKDFQFSLADWKRRFSKHPADFGFLQSYLNEAESSFKVPSSIALLLPESGRYSQAAKLIKEGFMAAYESSFSSFQPSLRFYDSSEGDASLLYKQAISNGAELVIGPLSKDNIQSLALSTSLTVPVLALNHIPDLSSNNLFQFGLSPIDETIQVSTKARQAGHIKALLLTPNTGKGQRINNYLSKYWEQLGGEIIETQSYAPNKNDFSGPIKELLNLNESKYRFKKVKQLLAYNSQFTERRRKDVDAILLSANPKIARSIYPQLRFYRATRIPVYSMSELYTGQLNATMDRDLDKITFCDIPWLFSASYPGELGKEALVDSWKKFPRKYIRLMALGIDSFNIIERLEELKVTPYLGATGKLLLNMENRITRQLVCAKFIKGEPVLQMPLYPEEVNAGYSGDLDQ